MKLTIVIFLSLFTYAEPEINKLDVYYEVPVENEALKEYAYFNLVNFQMTESQISFSLPESLTALALPKVTFERKVLDNGKVVFEGLFGKMNCEISEATEKSECFVKYNSKYKKILNIMGPAIEDEFDSVIEDSVILNARKEVFRIFKGDPLGVVYFPYALK